MSLPIVVSKTNGHPAARPAGRPSRWLRAGDGRRNADEHLAAAVRQAVVHGDLVALRRKLAGDRDARGTGTDDGDALLRGVIWGMTSGMPDASCHSTRNRFIARIASGRSMSPRRQARSQGAEQTYEHIAATGLGSRTGCSPPRTDPRPRGSDSRGNSFRPGTLPGTRCCTGARRRRRAGRGIPGAAR